MAKCKLSNQEVCGQVCVCEHMPEFFLYVVFLNEYVLCVCVKLGSWHSQHSTGIEEACSDSTFPLDWGMCTLNTTRTRVFFLPISVSPFRSSMSEFRSLRMPAQSILQGRGKNCWPHTAPLGEQSSEIYLCREGLGVIKPTTSPAGDWQWEAN